MTLTNYGEVFSLRTTRAGAAQAAQKRANVTASPAEAIAQRTCRQATEMPWWITVSTAVRSWADGLLSREIASRTAGESATRAAQPPPPSLVSRKASAASCWV